MISRKRVKKMFSQYRKRLKKYGFKESDGQHAFRTTGKPCSCYMCKNEKFNRKQKHKEELLIDE